MNTNIERLSQMLKRHFHFWIEAFKDEETGEDVTRVDSWNYADILWNGVRADAVQAAFDKLSRKEKYFL